MRVVESLENVQPHWACSSPTLHSITLESLVACLMSKHDVVRCGGEWLAAVCCQVIFTGLRGDAWAALPGATILLHDWPKHSFYGLRRSEGAVVLVSFEVLCEHILRAT